MWSVLLLGSDLLLRLEGHNAALGQLLRDACLALGQGALHLVELQTAETKETHKKNV